MPTVLAYIISAAVVFGLPLLLSATTGWSYSEILPSALAGITFHVYAMQLKGD